MTSMVFMVMMNVSQKKMVLMLLSMMMMMVMMMLMMMTLTISVQLRLFQQKFHNDVSKAVGLTVNFQCNPRFIQRTKRR